MRENICLIILDTLRKDYVSAYNSNINFTDNLGDFSDESIKYTNAVSQSIWSLPSQSSILTGKYPWEHNAGQKQPYLDGSHLTIIDYLKDKDMNTYGFTDNSWNSPVTGISNRFDFVYSEHSVPIIDEHRYWKFLNNNFSGLNKRILLKMSRYKQSKDSKKITDYRKIQKELDDKLKETVNEDSFYFINLLGCHYPYNPPTNYRKRHNCVDCEDLKSKPLEYGGRFYSDEKDKIKDLYKAEVDYIDDVFGSIINKFKVNGLYEDTLFIVASDHGEALGENNYFGHHFKVQDCLTDVPMFVKTPDNRNEIITQTIETRSIFDIILNYISDKEIYNLTTDKAYGYYDEPVIYNEVLYDDKYNEGDTYYTKSPKQTNYTKDIPKDKDFGLSDDKL